MHPPLKTLIILVNLGTPDTPSPWSVMHFLRKFLGDRRVVEIPPLIWKGILYTLILPIRSFKTAKLYQKIWTSEGSPLKMWTARLANRLQEDLSTHVTEPTVLYAMTYSRPTLENLLKEKKTEKVQKLIILPLFPYYSSTTTAAVWDVVASHFRKKRMVPSIHFLHEYGRDELFIEALAKSIERFWERFGRGERLLCSFHGVPNRIIEKGDTYKLSCQYTVKKLQERLKLTENFIYFSFQSRFGLGLWVTPYTDVILKEWALKGIKTVDVICPSFAVDCLETLEEITLQTKEKFIKFGGKNLRYISALNDEQEHVNLLSSIILKYF